VYPILLLLAAEIGPVAPGQAAREPQMAAAGSSIALTFGSGNAIYFTQSQDANSFPAPVKVAESDSLMLNRHRGPRIASTGKTLVITAVMGKPLSASLHMPSKSQGGDLVSWSSRDGGKTWSDGVIVNDVAGAASEGLHALAAGAHEQVFAAWLDKRDERGTKLYGALSTDGGASWHRNVLIYESPDGTICQCCHPSVAIDGNGSITVMWRNTLAGSRDLYIARSVGGGAFSKPEKLGNGTWKLNACPMDGGGLAFSGGRPVTVWRREHDIFLAKPGENESRIGTGMDPAIAAGNGRVFAIWSSSSGIQMWNSGRTSAVSSRGGFPALIVLPGSRPVAAWEEDGRIIVRSFSE